MFYVIFCALDQLREMAESLDLSKRGKVIAQDAIQKAIARVSFSSNLRMKSHEELNKENRSNHETKEETSSTGTLRRMDSSSSDKDSPGNGKLKRQKSLKEWKDRFLWGFLIGIFTAWAIVTGGFWFTIAIALTGSGGAWEYCKLVNSGAHSRGEKGINAHIVILCCFFSATLPLVTW